MNQPKQFNPVLWAVSVGIVFLCVAAAYSISLSCQPAKFEFFKLLKTELGGCSQSEVSPSNVPTTQINPSVLVNSNRTLS
jgi:hypothetical protein